MAVSLTLTAVRRAGGKTYAVFGKTVLEFASDAEAQRWANAIDFPDAAKKLLASIAIAKGLVPGGAGGNIGLTLTYDVAGATPLVVS